MTNAAKRIGEYLEERSNRKDLAQAWIHWIGLNGDECVELRSCDIQEILKQRDELLDALKSVSAWSESLNRIMPTWLDSEVDEAIASAEK